MAQNPGARGMDLAAKMMEKMGWKSGLGLGRNKQVRPLKLELACTCLMLTQPSFSVIKAAVSAGQH